VTEPATPSQPSDAPESPSPPPRKRYARERLAVGIVFFAVAGAVIVNGATVIWKDTYRDAMVRAPFATCSEGIATLYRDFLRKISPVDIVNGTLAPRHPSTDAMTRADVAMLDELLISLRPVCAREGAAAREAYDSMTLWRHQYQDHSNVAEHMFVPDAERALRYRSPGAAAPQGTEP
jgi:hypothetical protein